MSTDCLASTLEDGEEYFEDALYSLQEEWNSGALPPSAVADDVACCICAHSSTAFGDAQFGRYGPRQEGLHAAWSIRQHRRVHRDHVLQAQQSYN